MSHNMLQWGGHSTFVEVLRVVADSWRTIETRRGLRYSAMSSSQRPQ